MVPADLLSHRRFVPVDLLSRRRFVPYTFCPLDILSVDILSLYPNITYAIDMPPVLGHIHVQGKPWNETITIINVYLIQ